MAEKITQAAQENLISLLAHSNKHGRVIAALVDPELFEGDYRVIANRVVGYWKEHKKAPRLHTSDLLSDIIHDKKNRRSETYKRILRDMQGLAASGDINIAYVMQQLQQFTRLQHMKDAILRSADILQKQQELGIGDVEVMLADLMRAREFNFDKGLSLVDAIPRVADLLDKRMTEFSTGIRHFDDRHIAPYRRAAMIFLAPTGRGKSWFLVRLGKHAMLTRKKVVHVTLEMDDDEVSMRYYQSLFALPKYKIDTLELPSFKYERGIGHNSKSYIKTIGNYMVEPEASLSSTKGMRHLTGKVEEFERALRNLIVKRFPMRAVTVDDLDAYLDTLEAIGFMPDMLILDYLSLMKTAGGPKDFRISLGRTFEDFRGLCQRRNIAGVTAAQVGRVGMEAATLKVTHIAEDISLINTADIALTYSQTGAERRAHLARIYVDKARSDKDKFGCVITQAYEIGQFALQSALLNSDYFKLHAPKGKAEESDDDEDAGDEPDEPTRESEGKGRRKWRD